MTIHEVNVEIDDLKSTSLVAYNDRSSQVAGILRLDLDGYINSLWVSPQFRNAGLGGELIERACTVLRAKGKQVIGLSVHDKNEGAQRLYTRLGFLRYTASHEGYTQFVKTL